MTLRTRHWPRSPRPTGRPPPKFSAGATRNLVGDPNTHVCPGLLGLAGRVARASTKTSSIWRCGSRWPRVAPSSPRSRFLREKTTFTQTCPKGYQISQFQSHEEMPLATGGGIDISHRRQRDKDHPPHAHPHGRRRAGKSIHALGESLVDVNRCARAPHRDRDRTRESRLLKKLFTISPACTNCSCTPGVSEGDMEKGHMRIDANVSIRPVGETELGTKVETQKCQLVSQLPTRHRIRNPQRQIDLRETGGENRTNDHALRSGPQCVARHADERRIGRLSLFSRSGSRPGGRRSGLGRARSKPDSRTARRQTHALCQNFTAYLRIRSRC